jgi:chemotaxis protein methyltransferase CheR
MTEIKLDALEVKELTKSVHSKYGFDFSEYAISSFKRRLVRIMGLYAIESLTDLQNKIISEKSFYEFFLKEITVNTTEMFRDPFVWLHFREAIVPELKKLDKINIWHSACSTGEEVFSMAILLKEEGLLDRTQFVATDINADVVEIAKKGMYPTRNLQLHSDNYIASGGAKQLSDYYEYGKYETQFDLSLTKNVKFHVHDLIKGDNPDAFDVILCRNVLIYFNLPLQDQIIGKFSTCLNENGFLILGAKETIAWCSSSKAYKTFSFKEKTYQLKEK